ncbi:MAG: cupin domain-containing protein [Alphaproteobacteria bacterium]|nr:cupin domain-containing protein [Alphaproteobacteria bacterium]
MESALTEAQQIIHALALKPHPEGGHYRESFRDGGAESGRAHSTAIYFLLQEGEVSHWHRVDAAEVWHFYCGAPLELEMRIHNGARSRHILGIDIKSGQRPQIVVPRFVWQRARSLGPYTLVGCTVAPGFEFAGFELAATDWPPP